MHKQKSLVYVDHMAGLLVEKVYIAMVLITNTRANVKTILKSLNTLIVEAVKLPKLKKIVYVVFKKPLAVRTIIAMIINAPLNPNHNQFVTTICYFFFTINHSPPIVPSLLTKNVNHFVFPKSDGTLQKFRSELREDFLIS